MQCAPTKTERSILSLEGKEIEGNNTSTFDVVKQEVQMFSIRPQSGLHVIHVFHEFVESLRDQ